MSTNLKFKAHSTTNRGLRSVRTLAVKFVLEWQATGSASARSAQTALLLTASVTWLLNSIHSTMDLKQASRDLIRATLPHVARAEADHTILPFGKPSNDPDADSEAEAETDSDNDRVATLPAYPYGLVFLRKIRIGEKFPVPRFASNAQSYLTDKSFHFFFGVDKDEICDTYLAPFKVNAALNPTRVGNRTRNTPRWQDVAPVPIQEPIFSLARLGHCLNDIENDEGSDLEDEEDIIPADPQPIAEENDIDIQLSHLWRQFLMDLAIKAPNMQGFASGSYCCLNPGQRRAVTEATYRDRKLSNFFNDCQWRIVSDKEWEVTFTRLFPPPGHVFPRGVQQYKTAQYQTLWISLKARMDTGTYDKVRSKLLARSKTLYWLPAAANDRIWSTRLDTLSSRPPGNPLALAPRVLVRGGPPTW